MKRNKDDIVFESINIFFVTLFFIITLYPLVFVLIASISNPNLVATGKVLLFPKGITFEGYRRIFNYREVWSGYMNTIIYTFAGTIVGLILTLSGAYPLSRNDLVGKKFFVIMFTITMFFSGGLIPSYLLIKSLGMLDSIWSQIIPGITGFWYIVVVRTFYQKSIPMEIQEAASIDGCSNTRLFTTIILPLSKPVIAVMALFFAVNQWNSWFSALIYLSKRAMYPLQLILREILIIGQMSDEMMDSEEMDMVLKRVQTAQLLKYGLIIVSTLPIITVYPFLQKYFVKGMMVGSIKG